MTEGTGRDFESLMRRARERDTYWTERAVLEFTEELVRIMNEAGVSRAELARRIGSSQAYVTKVLSGNANFTVATMTKLVRAFDSELRIHIAPAGIGARTVWRDVIPGGVRMAAATPQSSAVHWPPDSDDESFEHFTSLPSSDQRLHGTLPLTA